MKIILKNLNVVILFLSLIGGNFAMVQQTALSVKVSDRST